MPGEPVDDTINEKLAQQFYQWVLGAVYLVSLPLLFLGWLWLPHQALLAARDEAQSPLAAEFLRSISTATTRVHDDAAAIRANTDRMVEIKLQYELLADTFPVWPIRTAALNRLVVASLLPFLSSLLASAIALTLKFVQGQDRSIWWLCTGTGQFTRVSSDLAEFQRLTLQPKPSRE